MKNVRKLLVIACVASLLSSSVAFAGAHAMGSSAPTTEGVRLKGS